jgi:predicted DNA-binding transcriptional regulator AlpA
MVEPWKVFIMKKQYLRATEVAEYLGIGLSTVWLYAKQGKITPLKLSSKVTVFSLKEIEKIMLDKFLEGL